MTMENSKCDNVKTGEKRNLSETSNISDHHGNTDNPSKKPLLEECEFHEETPVWAKDFFVKLMTKVTTLIDGNAETTNGLVESKFKIQKRWLRKIEQTFTI